MWCRKRDIDKLVHNTLFALTNDEVSKQKFRFNNQNAISKQIDGTLFCVEKSPRHEYGDPLL